jgi:YHS domain-containing protein
MTATDINTNRDGLAMHGYDPVAYFTLGQPTLGTPGHTHTWRGSTWHFATEAHREQFAADPERYAPQFGGYCALGRAMGVRVNGAPTRWRIDDHKLYLNKNLAAQAMHNLIAGRIRKLAAKG